MIHKGYWMQVGIWVYLTRAGNMVLFNMHELKITYLIWTAFTLGKYQLPIVYPAEIDMNGMIIAG